MVVWLFKIFRAWQRHVSAEALQTGTAQKIAKLYHPRRRLRSGVKTWVLLWMVTKRRIRWNSQKICELLFFVALMANCERTGKKISLSMRVRSETFRWIERIGAVPGPFRFRYADPTQKSTPWSEELSSHWSAASKMKLTDRNTSEYASKPSAWTQRSYGQTMFKKKKNRD